MILLSEVIKSVKKKKKKKKTTTTTTTIQPSKSKNTCQLVSYLDVIGGL